jgi:putative oxidoreductase
MATEGTVVLRLSITRGNVARASAAGPARAVTEISNWPRVYLDLGRQRMLDFVFGLSTRFPLARWAPIPLRLIVGYGFMEHGYSKLSKGPDTFAAILQAMGVPYPHLMAWATILVELCGGLAVILGAFVAIASVPMAAVLLVALITVHLPYGFSSIKLIAVTAAGPQFGPPGYEVDLLYLACLAALVMGGAGPFAVDDLMGRRGPGTNRR